MRAVSSMAKMYEHIAIEKLPGGAVLYHPARFRAKKPAKKSKTATSCRDDKSDKPAQELTGRAWLEHMPFGQYKGAPLDVVCHDVAYCQWLLQQPWFGLKYFVHKTYIASALERTFADEGPSAA
jgi:hypothetical protein